MANGFFIQIGINWIKSILLGIQWNITIELEFRLFLE